MQREHPTRVRRAPPDRDYDNITSFATKRARLVPQDDINSEPPTNTGRPPPTIQNQRPTLESTSVSKPTLSPQKKRLPAAVEAKSKRPGTSANTKTKEKQSAQVQETEDEDEDMPTEGGESIPEGPIDVDMMEDLEEETAEKELG
jgi:hypothetical protein